MRQGSTQKNHSEQAGEAGANRDLFDASPAFLCALPADVARLRPLFHAEAEEHGEARDAR